MMKAALDWFHSGGWVLCFAVTAFASSMVTRWSERRRNDQVVAQSRAEILEIIEQAREEQRIAAESQKGAGGEDEVQRLTRKCEEYFGVITSMEAQKNRYKLYWLEQAREHAVGQSLYERALVEARQIALKAIGIVNHYKKLAGEPEIKSPKELAGLPVGQVDAYRAKIEAQIAECPPEVDGAAEQRRIGPPGPAPEPEKSA